MARGSNGDGPNVEALEIRDSSCGGTFNRMALCRTTIAWRTCDVSASPPVHGQSSTVCFGSVLSNAKRYNRVSHGERSRSAARTVLLSKGHGQEFESSLVWDSWLVFALW